MVRRDFLFRGIGAAALACLAGPGRLLANGEADRRAGAKIKLALNSYSFNEPLMKGKMSLADVVDYCAEHGIDGMDATGYYFPGYPSVPSDEAIFMLKRKAYLDGVGINGTGIRNDFASPDPGTRRKGVELAKAWTGVAQKLGAGMIRVYSGPGLPAGHAREEVLAWMVPALRECADYGRARGVVVAVQPHDDFLKTADQVIELVHGVDSEWFSVVLDIGSLRQGDPYAETEKLLPYSCSWQIKETVYVAGKPMPVDLPRVRAIIERVGYRGFLPIEALEAGNSTEAVTRFLGQVRKAML